MTSNAQTWLNQERDINREEDFCVFSLNTHRQGINVPDGVIKIKF